MTWALASGIAGGLASSVAVHAVAASALLDGSESDGTNALTTGINLDLATLIQNSRTLDATTAPDGTVKASLFTEDTANTRHIVYYIVSGAATGAFRLSVYAKSNGRRYLVVYAIDSSTNSVSAYFDLQAGTQTDNEVGGTGIYTSSQIQAAVNGFYKCTLTGDFGASETGNRYFLFAMSNVATYGAPLDSDNPSYTGDGTSGVYLWRPKMVDI